MTSHSSHRQMQQEILDRAVAILRADPRVLGVVVTGSCARGEQDAFSDVDAACYLRDEAQAGKLELFERVGQIGPTLWQLLIYDVNALYLFENGVRLDLDFLKPSDLAHPTYVYADARILHDPDGALAQGLALPAAPPAAEHPKWFQPGDPAMLDWFFWMFRQAVCWAKRAARPDHRAYDKLANAVSSLADVRARLVEMRLWTLGSKDYLSRADPGLAARLALTYPHLAPGEVIDCARRLLDEYEYVTPAYCQKCGAAYPARKAAVMRALIDEFERIE